jgi:hypothetical protein
MKDDRLMLARVHRVLAAAVSTAMVAALTACGSGDVGQQPNITVSNPAATGKLQFSVGTATINETSLNQVYTVLNTVETLRQPNGLSDVITDTPYITGPPGFVGQKDPVTQGPTNTITGSGPGIACNATTFGCSGGAFGYGFAPDNPLPQQNQPSFALYPVPVAVSNQDILGSYPYYSGPPAFPPFNNGTYPAGFLGYTPGFVDFQSSPVLGDYTLKVDIANGQGSFSSISATAKLTSTTGLPPLQAPQSFPDPNNPGGLKIDIVVPSGVTETWVWVQDSGACYPHTQGNSKNVQYYTVITTQTGAQQLTIPPNLGPTNGSGSTPTICSSQDNQIATGNPNAPGDTYLVYVIGFDYPAYEAAYPATRSQTPIIVGPTGQADLTATQPAFFTEP